MDQENPSPGVPANLGLRFSPRGQRLLKSFESGPAGNRAPEGYAPLPYRDPAALLTIGWGHLIRMTDRLAAPIDLARAQELFEADVGPTEVYIRGCCATTQLTQNEYDALACFVFNVGIRAFETSTMRKMIVKGDMAGAALQFALWNKITITSPKGKKMVLVADGLVIRRTLERMLFLGEDDGAIAIARAALEARAAAGSLA